MIGNMMPMKKRIVRVALSVFTIVALYHVLTIFLSCSESPSLSYLSVTRQPSKETFKKLSLTENQCRATFPGLMKEIDEAVARGPLKLVKEPDDYQGLVQGKIKDGKVIKILTILGRITED